MAGKGGYQPPASPAPVSGPGELARRTDGGPGQPIRELPDADYGEQQTFRADQQGAPMAAAPTPGQAAVMPADLSRVVPLSAGTVRPGEPITSGANAGPGPDAGSLGLNDPQTTARYRNMLSSMELLANMPGSSPAFRTFVRALRAVV